MKPLKQRFKHDPGNGVWGDCHRAAIASVLEVTLDDVPHFAEGGCAGEEFERRERVFLKNQGLVPIRVPFEHELPTLLRSLKAINPGTYYLLGGQSKTGVNHTVVGLDDAIVHDPSITDAGIVGPCDDGLYWVTFFGCACAAQTGGVAYAPGPSGECPICGQVACACGEKPGDGGY